MKAPKIGLILSVLLGLMTSQPVIARETVLVFAAASTTDVIKTIVKKYGQTTENTVLTSFAASSTLARQIEKGAPADIYISANIKWMAYLSKKGMIENSAPAVLFSNALVLITPRDRPLDLTINEELPLLTILDGGYMSLANPDHTPVGVYAKQSLQTLGLWDSIQHRVARTKDVRSALMLVERKETVLGIVYQTDALVSHKVMIAGRFPSDSHPPIRYLASLTGKQPKAEADSFYRFLASDTARKIYQSHGFKTDIP